MTCLFIPSSVGNSMRPLSALQTAIVDVAKQFHFSIRRQGFTFVCSRAMRNYTRKAIISSAPLQGFQTFKVECPFRICFNYVDRKLKHELTEAEQQAGGRLLSARFTPGVTCSILPFLGRVPITSPCMPVWISCCIGLNKSLCLWMVVVSFFHLYLFNYLH